MVESLRRHTRTNYGPPSGLLIATNAEDDGGATSGAPASSLHGTPNQVEWADRIKCAVNDEFDRVAAAFRGVAAKQTCAKRAETEAVIAILEDKRIGVLSIRRAGYFIKFWQEITDQVRQLIFDDPRYQEIKTQREGRRQVTP